MKKLCTYVSVFEVEVASAISSLRRRRKSGSAAKLIKAWWTALTVTTLSQLGSSLTEEKSKDYFCDNSSAP